MSETLLRELGQRIRARRLHRGLSQGRLAELAHLSPRFVSQIESGRGNISILRLHDLAQALETPLEELVRTDGGTRVIALIGLLGGRSWTSRLAWSLMVLFFTSLVLLLIMVIVYPNVVEPRIQDIQLDPLEYEGVEAVLVEKGNEIIGNVFDGYFGGMRNILLFMVIGSGVPLAGLIVWRRMILRRDTRTD